MIDDQILGESRVVDQGLKESKISFQVFVPIDFSHGSYNALEYAMRIARMCDGTLELFHVVDGNELPNSESPLTVKHGLSMIKERAARKLNSLIEIIESNGVTVVNNGVRVGNPGGIIANHLEESAPDLIVVGQGTRMDKLISKKNLTTPIMIIPPSIKLSIPFKALLIRDNKSVNEDALKPLLKLVQSGSNKLTVLDLNSSPIQKFFSYILPVGGSMIYARRYGMLTSSKGEFGRFIGKHKPDLICKILRPPTFFEQIFSFLFRTRQYGGYDIPTLILPA